MTVLPLEISTTCRADRRHKAVAIHNQSIDPGGANLDRIQVVKLWLAGETFKEKVYDAVLSGGRRDDPATGRAPGVGNTVDRGTGKAANSIGAAELQAVWTAPEFDPKTSALYCIRVLQIPTARWSTFLAIRNHLPAPKSVPATIQERGWSPPIRYTPTAH